MRRDDRGGECEALNGVGEALCATGQSASARANHLAALALAGETGHHYEQARAHAGIAHAHHIIGENAQARRHWQNALTHYTDLDIPDADDVRAQLAALGRIGRRRSS